MQSSQTTFQAVLPVTYHTLFFIYNDDTSISRLHDMAVFMFFTVIAVVKDFLTDSTFHNGLI